MLLSYSSCGNRCVVGPQAGNWSGRRGGQAGISRRRCPFLGRGPTNLKMGGGVEAWGGGGDREGEEAVGSPKKQGPPDHL